MSKTIKLEVPKACHEDWNKFSQTEKGAFCESCRKEVIDFTVLSDQEIKEYFRSYTHAAVCGRFRKEQLNRSMQTSDSDRSPFLKVASIAVGLVAYMSSTPVRSQVATIKAPYTSAPDSKPLYSEAQNIVPKKAEVDSLSGEVLDAETNQPVPGVFVRIKNSNITTKTNSKGNFILNVEDGLSFTDTLVFRSFEYGEVEIPISEIKAKDGKIKLQAVVENCTVVLGGAIVVRKQNFFQRIFGKIKRLFA